MSTQGSMLNTFALICLFACLFVALGFKNDYDWFVSGFILFGFLGGAWICREEFKSVLGIIACVVFSVIVAGILAWINQPENVEESILFGAGFGFFFGLKKMFA